MRRLRWRCRRGLLELDLLLARFLDHGYSALSVEQRAGFERMLAMDDNTLWALFNGTSVADEKEFADLVDRIRAPASG